MRPSSADARMGGMGLDAKHTGDGYIGKPLRRREDARFVRGRGLYVDDVVLPGLAWCAFVRSPHAHARIVSLSTRAAAARPGVLLTLTADDWDRAGHGELTVVHPMPFGDGRPMNAAPRPAFARDKVHHVGDIVAAVVADTRFAAEDAAEAVEVAYDPLPAVTTPRDAVAPGAPLVHARFGSNLVFEIERGDRRKTEAAMAAAAKVVELSLNNNRLSANPIEPRSYLCDYDAARDRYTLHATTQQPHYLRRWLSVYTLHIPEHKIRVISPDVGGAFGVKGNFAVEVSTVVWAAQLLRRPVKWTATRTETFLSDAQARDHDTTARMGFDRDGRIVAMQIDTLAALGGYLSNFAPSIPGNSYPQTVTGLYKTPNLHLRVRGVYTNTVPVDAYRGSGRPEATWTNERLIERGARELGIDAVEIRRRNLIARADFPYPAPGGRVYDSGDPPALLDRLLAAADYAALRREQGRLRSRGVLMGIGLAAFIDKAGTGPSANLAKRGGLHGGWESAIVRVHSDGKVTIFSGSHSHGQGHEITFCQIAADRLGLPIDDIAWSKGIPIRCRSATAPGGRSRTCAWSRAIPTRSRSATGPGARARLRWRGRRSTAPPARSSTRHGASPRNCSNARRATSTMAAALSQCAAPTGRLRSPRWPTSPITARCCRRAARPASKSPSSTIRPIPTIRRPSISPWSPSMPRPAPCDCAPSMPPTIAAWSSIR